jgi:hypothetical protein
MRKFLAYLRSLHRPPCDPAAARPQSPDDASAAEEIALTEEQFIAECRKGSTRCVEWDAGNFEFAIIRETAFAPDGSTPGGYRTQGFMVPVSEEVRFSRVLVLSRHNWVFVPLHDPDAARPTGGTAWTTRTGPDFHRFASAPGWGTLVMDEMLIIASARPSAPGPFRVLETRSAFDILRQRAPELLEGLGLSPEELSRIGREVVRASPFHVDASVIPEATQPAPARKRL